MQGYEKRLVELYEKGVLTKEEARSCVQELKGTSCYFVEEERRQGFRLPHFRFLSPSRKPERYTLEEEIEALSISLVGGTFHLTKSKSDAVQIAVYQAGQESETSPIQLHLTDQRLRLSSNRPCQIVLSVPDRWMSVLDMEIGKASLRLSFLPFEDMSIRSKTDHKQQDIRLYTDALYTQHLFLSLGQAHVSVEVAKNKGVAVQLQAPLSPLVVNKQPQISPFFGKKPGQHPLYIKARTQCSPFILKGVTACLDGINKGEEDS